MNYGILLFFFLLTYLYFVCRKITRRLYHLILLLTGKNRLAVYLVAAVFLPGTAVHELSHFLAATLLRVPTGSISIIPKVEEGGTIKTGRMEMAEIDPFRHALIGTAPLFIGLLIIYFTGKILINNSPVALISNFRFPISLLAFYLFFTVSTTMFLSRRDLEGLKIAGPVILLIYITLYIIGVRVVPDKNLIEVINRTVSNLNYYLILASITDFLVFAVIDLKLLFWQWVLKKRIVK